jgi:hypothetical protein
VAGLALVLALTACSSGDSSPETATSSAPGIIIAESAPSQATTVAPVQAVTTSPTSTPAAETSTTTDLLPEEGFIQKVGKSPTGDVMNCGDPKLTVSFDLRIGGSKTHNDTKITTTRDTEAFMTITIDGRSSIYAIIVNGNSAAPVTQAQRALDKVTFKLRTADWGLINKLTVCADRTITD